MNFYQINTPVFTNDGKANYEEARKRLEAYILTKAGGLTRFPITHGEWCDPVTAKTYVDPIVPIQFATSDTRVMTDILDKAIELFHDQEAIFIAKIGTATIRYRNPEEPPKGIGKFVTTKKA